MLKKLCVFIGLLAVLSASTGCAVTRISRLELDYGTSFKLAKFSQTLNPEAEKNLEPVYGLEGQAAREAMERYREIFRERAEEPVYTFSIGKQ